MFRHTGKGRTFKHNLRVAVFLSFIAGVVNICGVLWVNVLTTNVTGHFAFFSEELFRENRWLAATFLLYILAFLCGAFVSSFITEFLLRRRFRQPHRISMFIEALFLLITGLTGNILVSNGLSAIYVAGMLLFAMGMQNSLVTLISDRVVRTTHLTGLFTDLGIELSQLFFYKEKEQRKKLHRSIELRLAIILFFFAGCVCGGFLFKYLQELTLVLTAALLGLALLYDKFLFNYYRMVRRKNQSS